MRKYLLLFIVAIFAMSCSKKVEIKGKVTGGSPLERIEIVEATGVATLPLVNMGVDKDGNFTGSFEAPKDGMYLISYGQNKNLIYLKGGQNLQISGNAMTFPNEYVVTGDAKKNNDFFMATQKFITNYAQKVNMNDLMGKDEKTFVQGLQKIEGDINKNVEENIQKFSPDKEVINWKKIDVASTMLSILTQYEMRQKQFSGNPSYKPTKIFTDYETKLQGSNKDEMVKESPGYRSYLLTKMSEGFTKFAEEKSKVKKDITTTEMFNEYLKTQKDLSQTEKDYLLAFVMAQSDILPSAPVKTIDVIKKITTEDIKDAKVKKDLEALQFAMFGPKKGEVAPEAAMVKADGKAFKFSDNKGKPTLVMFYASWNPYIAESVVPVLKEVVNFYKSKMDFVYVNVDDSKDQFTKTSASLLKGIPGTNVYGDGGLKSEIAKKYGIYGLKIPCFFVIDKDGKVASKQFFNLGEQELVEILDKQTGLSAPKVDPRVQLESGYIPQEAVPTPQEAPAAPAQK